VLRLSPWVAFLDPAEPKAAATPGTAVERLAQYLYDRDPEDALARELRAWLAGSPRFRAFAEAHRDKIRKKLRGAADAEALQDVRAELQTARLLLADRRIELAFEAYGSGKTGPDFTVTFRGARSFNLEVTRLRRVPDAGGLGASLLAKLRQLPPSAPNAVLFAIDGETAEALDIDAATRALRSRADAKDEAFFTTRGSDGTRAFYERYLRLGAVLVSAEGASGSARATLWFNRSARIALPEPAARACLRSLRAEA
jgi:hypothetical protein